jgi:glycosyltransferase involved in cell wall biosynthesis
MGSKVLMIGAYPLEPGVDDDTGFVVESGGVATLADRLRTLLNDQDLCLRMGRRGHEVALSRFQPGAVARRTAEAYRTALS